jgi:hypothetical protein
VVLSVEYLREWYNCVLIQVRDSYVNQFLYYEYQLLNQFGHCMELLEKGRLVSIHMDVYQSVESL